jgi:pimeloyl-ACP methyl ester carboxylesterase
MAQPRILSQERIEELNKTLRIFTLKGGRKIAYYQYGDPTGKPIFFCHGTGSHVHVMLLDDAARAHGYRIIVPDRPGVGLSDFSPQRKLLDGASDISLLADELGIEKFGLMGISGGGPTVLACAYSIPERLNFAVDLAGAVPLYNDPEALKKLGAIDRFYAKIGNYLPLFLFQIPFALLGFQQRMLKNPKAFSDMMRSSMCQADMELFNIPEMQYVFMRDFQELFRQGSCGPALDAQLIYHSWGFDVSKITMHLEIRQGSQDRWIPPYFSQYLANTLPDAKLNLIEGQGHFYHMAYADSTMSFVDQIAH